MNPRPYIHVFAFISIMALGFHIFSDFWLPMILGAAGTLVLSWLLRK